jgi:oligopeptide/dipeptide ABC transporter ATP-binding protein
VTSPDSLDTSTIRSDEPRLLQADAARLLSVEGLTIDLTGETPQHGLIENVSFSVEQGKSLALIGESGCGKTLTAMSILGLLPPKLQVTSGKIMFEGRDLAQSSKRELQRIRGRSIGMVFQEPMSSLNPTMTIGDQIGEARELHLHERRRTARKRAQELLDHVGIPNSARRVRAYPHELSGGMQQRVMIAAAIACDPRLLIADEPTTALDVTIQAEILDLLRRLREELSLAVLLVTHDLGVVADFCEDVVVMYAGRAVERAPIDDVFMTPQHPYSGALLASMPQTAHPRTQLAAIPGHVPGPGSFPSGCRFRPRCQYANDTSCAAEQIDVELAAGHLTQCARVASGEIRVGGVG